MDALFPSLLKIEASSTMVSDHLLWKYAEALNVAIASRVADDVPPEWVPWDHTKACNVCERVFLNEQTGEGAGAMKNCRSCGQLVCTRCARGKKAVPHFGIVNAVRVCDTCSGLLK